MYVREDQRWLVIALTIFMALTILIAHIDLWALLGRARQELTKIEDCDGLSKSVRVRKLVSPLRIIERRIWKTTLYLIMMEPSGTVMIKYCIPQCSIRTVEHGAFNAKVMGMIPIKPIKCMDKMFR